MRKSNVVALAAIVAGMVAWSGCARTIRQGGLEPSLSGDDEDGGVDASVVAQPTFPATVVASVRPPPISGGTLLVTHDGHTVVASDPDRDQAYVVDTATRKVTHTIALQPGDEPGRLAEDGTGLVYVALRGAGVLVTLDPTRGVVVERRPVCPAPRGVAWDSTAGVVHVACATGELVTLPTGTGVPTRTVTVERDLRDVIVHDGALSVTTFRASEVLDLASDGTVAARISLDPQGFTAGIAQGQSQVAWRAIADGAGGLVVLHQLESTEPIATSVNGTPVRGAYGGAGGMSGNGVCSAEMVVLGPDGTRLFEQQLSEMVLAVDVALSPDGTHALIAAAGNAFTDELPQVVSVGLGQEANGDLEPVGSIAGQAIAVGFDAAGEQLAQTREPATLWITAPGSSNSTPLVLSTISRADTGHDVFTTQSGALLACESCHPEGGDDGHVWLLDGAMRRTASLRGTIAGTAPYHWPGDEKDFTALVGDVYEGRMNGPALTPGQVAALQSWVEAIPAPPTPSWVDPQSAARGQALFEGSRTGCSTCHNGPKLTNNLTVNVGTGGAFQVPPLVGVGWREPVLHDGCAQTLADRFGSCATPGHGATAGLASQDVDDLVAYLQTL